MTVITFRSKTLKRQFASYKWARNNTLQLFKIAVDSSKLAYSPHENQHSILYQFQCLASTDDAYHRKLTNHPDSRFGMIIDGSTMTKKTDISQQELKNLLEAGLRTLEELLMEFTDEQFEEHAQTIQSIFNHEYLHQGQLVVLYRQANIPLPERFRNAFDL